MNEALIRRLQGQKDARGKVGMFSRGKNIYKGGTPNAHAGGGVTFGRPPVGAMSRRLRRRSRGTQ